MVCHSLFRKKIKKIISLFSVFLLLFSAFGCDKKEKEEEEEINKEEYFIVEEGEIDLDSSNVCIIYFQIDNNLEDIAITIAKNIEADFYELYPASAYNTTDLDTSDPNSRICLEQNDPSFRTEIWNKVNDLNDFDTIFLGYPIWINDAPKIIYTLLESYDFTDKKIIPFALSDQYDINDSLENIKKSALTANWQNGITFAFNHTETDILDWLSQLSVR